MKGIVHNRQMLVTESTLTFHYLYFNCLCFLREDSGYIDAVEASSQNTNDKKVEDEADEINPTLFFAGAICNFLLDPLLFQIRLGI